MKGVLAALLLGLSSLAAWAGELRPNITGTISDAAGKPVKDAMVFVWTAGPRQGTSSYCPSCYPDCIKRVTTTADGSFTISSLDPELLFRLLVACPGYSAEFINKVDPSKGPVSASLKPLDTSTIPPDQKLTGRVLDTDGDPVVGAVVHFSSYRDKSGRGCGGACDGFAQLAVSDLLGRFTLPADRPFATMSVQVEARGFAKLHYNDLPNKTAQEIRLVRGATVKGRLMRGKRPVAGALIGLVSVDRSMESFSGLYTIGTDRDGHFLFANLPPNTAYLVYSTMAEAKRLDGVAPAQRVNVGGNGTTADMGELAILPSYTIRGRFVTSDGKAIPTGTRAMISQDSAWDSIPNVEVAPDGAFEISGVPSASVSLHVALPGYHPSKKNPSLDQLNSSGLVGTVDQDINGISILMEPGPAERFDHSKQAYTPDLRPKDKPLRGIDLKTLPSSSAN